MQDLVPKRGLSNVNGIDAGGGSGRSHAPRRDGSNDHIEQHRMLWAPSLQQHQQGMWFQLQQHQQVMRLQLQEQYMRAQMHAQMQPQHVSMLARAAHAAEIGMTAFGGVAVMQVPSTIAGGGCGVVQERTGASGDVARAAGSVGVPTEKMSTTCVRKGCSKRVMEMGRETVVFAFAGRELLPCRAIKCPQAGCDVRCCHDSVLCRQSLRHHWEDHALADVDGAEVLKTDHSLALYFHHYFMVGETSSGDMAQNYEKTQKNAEKLCMRPRFCQVCDESVDVKCCDVCEAAMGPAVFSAPTGAKTKTATWLCVFCYRQTRANGCASVTEASSSGTSIFGDDACCLYWYAQ